MKTKKSYTDSDGRRWRLVGFYGNNHPIYEAVTTKAEREYIKDQKGLYHRVSFRPAS